jgi:RNA polymerase sigma-70 factor (ECF subfamily)
MLNLATNYAALDEDALVRLAQAGDREAFRAIMTRCNQRLFRLARGVVGNDADAEDVLQEAYLKAFAAITGFRHEAGLFTWLSAITLNAAKSRLRRRRPMVEFDRMDDRGNVVLLNETNVARNPEAEAARAQIRHVLERAVDEVPLDFRLVFLMREVEGCSVEETAAQLGLKAATVKTRHHRAKRMLRAALDRELADALHDTFPFLGARCAAITDRVLGKM